MPLLIFATCSTIIISHCRLVRIIFCYLIWNVFKLSLEVMSVLVGVFGSCIIQMNFHPVNAVR